jgi:methyl coenzyme M reductase subunit D
MSQEAIMSKMEQELFSIDQEKQQNDKNKAPVNDPIRHSRQVVFQLRKKAGQVLVELEDDRAQLERIQKASEQASLMDDIQKTLYLRVDGLLQAISEQVVKEKRVANHNANIFWY